MKQLMCEMCGSKDLVKDEGLFVCQSCGCKYTVEEARKMMVEGTVEIAGTVEVTGSVKIDNSENLLKRGFMALEGKKWKDAVDFFNKVLDENAECADAYLGLFLAGRLCTSLEDISKSTSDYGKTVNYLNFLKYGNEDDPRIKMLKEHLDDKYITKDGFRIKKDGNVLMNCMNGGEVTLPDGIERIATHSFDEVGSTLEKLIIPDGVKTIGEGAFSGCKKLTSVTVPGSVEEIPKKAFYYCGNLTDVKLADGIRKIGKNAFEKCESLKEIVLPKSLTEIGSFAFSGCKSLEYIEIPDSVVDIGIDTFSNCENMKGIKLSAGLTELRGSNFRNSGLVEIELPQNISKVETGVFSNCAKLKKLTVLNPNCEFGKTVFGWINSQNTTTSVEFVGSVQNLINLEKSENFLVRNIMAQRRSQGVCMYCGKSGFTGLIIKKCINCGNNKNY